MVLNSYGGFGVVSHQYGAVALSAGKPVENNQKVIVMKEASWLYTQSEIEVRNSGSVIRSHDTPKSSVRTPSETNEEPQIGKKPTTHRMSVNDQDRKIRSSYSPDEFSYPREWIPALWMIDSTISLLTPKSPERGTLRVPILGEFPNLSP